jgi:hypothetical protein
MGRNFKILTAVLVSFYGIYLFIIPALLNMPQVSKYVTQTIQNEINIPVNISNPHFKTGILPSIKIKADKISVSDDNNKNVLVIDKPYIDIELLPLIFKNLYINKLTAENAYADFNISKNLILKLGNYNIKDIRLPYSLKKYNANIAKYKINLTDTYTNNTTVISSQNGLATTFRDNKNVSLKTNTFICTGKKSALINIDGNLQLPFKNIDTDKIILNGYIQNLDLSDFSPYINYFSKGEYKRSSGVINFTSKTSKYSNRKNILMNLNIKDFGIYQQDSAKSIFFKEKLKATSVLQFTKRTLTIKSVSVSGKNIAAFISGKISDINSNNPKQNLNITVNKSRTETIISLLPGSETLSPDINLYLLKKSPLYGDIIGNLHIEGDTKTPNINGNILISNSYLIKPIKNTAGATIKLNFADDILNLYVNVPISKNQNVWVKGPVELYGNKYADLKITSTKAVDLATAEFVLNPLHEILHFLIGPVPVMKLDGKGLIDLRVTGNTKNPHAFGWFKFYNTTASFNDVHNMILKNGSGILTFKNLDTVFKTKSATLNGRPVSVDGTCNLFGDFDFKVKTSKQNPNNIIKIVQTSPMLKDISNLIAEIENASGLADLQLNITGHVKDPKDMKFLKNVFAKGNLKLTNSSFKIKSAPAKISKVNGTVGFNNTDAKIDMKGYINNSSILIIGKIKDSIADMKISSNKFHAGDIFAFLPKNIKLPYRTDLNNIISSFVASYKGSVTKIDTNKIFIKGKIYSNKAYNPNLLVSNSSFELKNSSFKINKLYGKIRNYPYFLSLNIKNAFDKDIKVNGNIKINQLDVSIINDIIEILPTNISKKISDYKDLSGNVNLSAKIENNNIRAYSTLDNVSFYYVPKNMKFSIISGNIFINNENINLNKLNSKLGGMPILINGKVSNIYKNPYLNLYINAKPSQDFIDSYVNNKMVYPLKIKGDLNLTSYAKGYLKDLNTKSKLSLTPNSSIYYMGSTLGDIENSVVLNINSNYSKNHIKLNSLEYDKIIESQNNEPFANHQLIASGDIYLLKDNLVRLKNLKVKTLTPTDAKIFNIVFKKPIMKQGIFTTNLVVNGKSNDLKAIGKINVTSVDMPFYNSTIRDISMDLKPEKILVTLKGEILSNDISFNGIMKNKLSAPFVVEDVKVKLHDLNIDTITDALRDYEVESTQTKTTSAIQNLDLSQFIIRNAEVFADKVKMKNISATNFEANGSLNNKMLLTIDKYKFNIAQGKVSGDSYYNLLSHQIGMKMHAENANAQMLSEALFDLKNQIYGSVTGDIDLTCNGKSHKKMYANTSR